MSADAPGLLAGKAFNNNNKSHLSLVCVRWHFPASLAFDSGIVHCRDAPVSQDKMIRPEDIAQAALLPFRMSPYACPTDIVVRPAQKLS